MIFMDRRWQFQFPGPSGAAVSARTGRIIQCAFHCVHARCTEHTEGELQHKGNHMLISDDNGLSWRLGAVVAEGATDDAATPMAQQMAPQRASPMAAPTRRGEPSPLLSAEYHPRLCQVQHAAASATKARVKSLLPRHPVATWKP